MSEMTSLPVLSLGQVINIGGQMFTLTSAPTTASGQFNNLNASSGNLVTTGQQHSSVSGLEGTESSVAGPHVEIGPDPEVSMELELATFSHV